MYDVTITSFMCFHQRKGLRFKKVILTSNFTFMLGFELSDPNLISISKKKKPSTRLDRRVLGFPIHKKYDLDKSCCSL